MPLSSARAAVVEVPGEIPSLQAAVDAAVAGDIILLAPGEYAGFCELKVGVSIHGTGAGPEATILTGSYQAPVARLLGPGEPVRLENLSIVNAYGYDGGALAVDGGAEVLAHRVHFVGNGCDHEGGALWARNSRVELTECFFYANYALGGGGGSVHLEAEPGFAAAPSIIRNCTFAGNSGCNGAICLVLDGGDYLIENNILEGVTCLGGAQADFRCNNGDICGLDLGGNFATNPGFCGFELGDCRLEADSPCLAPNNPACGLIGAFGACDLIPTATQARSLSAMKALFRSAAPVR